MSDNKSINTIAPVTRFLVPEGHIKKKAEEIEEKINQKNILLVDDKKEIRLVVSTFLKKWGYQIIQAINGIQAWEILEKEKIDIVISDWMMPGMDGLELCKKIREANFSSYIYIIILTAKNAKDDIIAGMEAGADDFMVKPFNKEELKVRIMAGERVLNLEKALDERNNKLSEANSELNKIYSLLKNDLEAAAKMQKSLLPGSALTLDRFKFDWIFFPCSFLAGDIFNFFKLDQDHIGFYLLDVAGHGISAAMLSVTLSHNLSPSYFSNTILRQYISASNYKITPPSRVVKELNMLYLSDKDSLQYFTMIYGIINTKDNRVTFTQAGHPSPLYISRGNTTIIGTGGFPVGILPDLDYEEHTITLNRGERLFIYSDGLTDCMNKSSKYFSVNRLIKLLEGWSHISLEELIKRLKNTLLLWNDNNLFQDDISLLAIEAL